MASTSNQHPFLEAIWIKRSHRRPMDPVDSAELDPELGIIGNVDRSRRRQVTLIEHEVWSQLMTELGAAADTSARRANLVLRGISLAHTRGRVLRIGDVRLIIGGETTPCERMDDVVPGLQEAMRRDWGGGAFAQILSHGRIRVGDAIEWEASAVPLNNHEPATNPPTTNQPRALPLISRQSLGWLSASLPPHRAKNARRGPRLTALRAVRTAMRSGHNECEIRVPDRTAVQTAEEA